MRERPVRHNRHTSGGLCPVTRSARDVVGQGTGQRGATGPSRDRAGECVDSRTPAAAGPGGRPGWIDQEVRAAPLLREPTEGSGA